MMRRPPRPAPFPYPTPFRSLSVAPVQVLPPALQIVLERPRLARQSQQHVAGVLRVREHGLHRGQVADVQEIGRAHVSTPVTSAARMPASPCKKKVNMATSRP